MKTTQHLWKNCLAMGTVAIVLPLSAMAHGLAGDEPEICPPMSAAGLMALPPPELFPSALPPGFMPMPPYLNGLELTEDQQDKLFELVHAIAPSEREQMKTAFKAMEELHRLAASEHFEVGKARVFAEAHAQAMAQVDLMHAELDAKVRTLLTPEQRKQLDEERSKAESRNCFKGAPTRHGTPR
jgi:Spy/CpxP family protein refolding chaperone